MSEQEKDGQGTLNERDQRFVDAMKQAYEPQPLTSVGRAALRQQIEERAGERASWRPAPTLGVAVAAGAALWIVVLSPMFSPAPPPTPGFNWEEALLETDAAISRETGTLVEILPDDYAELDAYLGDV